MEEMESDPFRRIKMEIFTLADASSQVLDLYDKIDQNKTPVITVDYALISGFIRPDQRHKPTLNDVGFDRDIDFVGSRIFELFAQFGNTAPYQLAFSEPTVIEFEQSAQRRSAALISIMGSSQSEKLFDKFMSFIEDDAEGSALESGIRDDELYKRAKILFEHAKSFFNKGATNSLLEMIRNNKVQGLGEFYTEDQFRAVKSQIYEDAMKVFDFLNANRSHGVSADFNNFIDALNFAFAFHLNAIKNDVSLSYAAPFPRLPRPTFHASRIQAMLERRSLPASLLIELNARKFVSEAVSKGVERLRFL